MDNKTFRRLLRREQTPAERILWYALKARRFHQLKFRRQHSLGKYIVDFYCPRLKLIIEVDGEIHCNLGQLYYDEVRDSYLQSLGLKILRFDNDTIIKNLETVLVEIENVDGQTLEYSSD